MLLGYFVCVILENVVSSFIGKQDLFCVCQIPLWFPSIFHCGVPFPFD
jgi:hypothetical protein